MICFILIYMKFITIKSFVIYKCIHLFLLNIDKFSYNIVLYIFKIIYTNLLYIHLYTIFQTNDFFYCTFSYKTKEIDSLYYVCSIYCT